MGCTLDTAPLPLETGKHLYWLEEHGGTWEVWGVQCGWNEVHSHVRVTMPDGRTGVGSDIAHAVAHVYRP